MALEGEECLVMLEDPYCALVGSVEEVKTLLGGKAYDEAIKDLALAQTEARSKGKDFRLRDCRLCHRCLDIVQPADSQLGLVCPSSDIDYEPTMTPFAFKHTNIHSDYSVIPLIFAKKQREERGSEFAGYCHPYRKTYTNTCGRYYCSECLNDLEEGEKMRADETEGEHCRRPKRKRPLSSKNSKMLMCSFCMSMCDCERCLALDSFNRLAAYYECFQGNFLRDVVPELVFLNFGAINFNLIPLGAKKVDEIWVKISGSLEEQEQEISFKINIVQETEERFVSFKHRETEGLVPEQRSEEARPESY
jgi:hypothetical protein